MHEYVVHLIKRSSNFLLSKTESENEICKTKSEKHFQFFIPLWSEWDFGGRKMLPLLSRMDHILLDLLRSLTEGVVILRPHLGQSRLRWLHDRALLSRTFWSCASSQHGTCRCICKVWGIFQSHLVLYRLRRRRVTARMTRSCFGGG